MQLMLVKSAFAVEIATSLTNLLPGAHGEQFLFPPGLDCST
jgi:hypothetical protein